MSTETRTLIGDMLVGKDENENGGNLVVEGTLTAPSIVTQEIVVEKYTTSFVYADETVLTLNHNLNTSTPKIVVKDIGGNLILGGVKIVTQNQVTIDISPGAISSGTAITIEITK